MRLSLFRLSLVAVGSLLFLLPAAYWGAWQSLQAMFNSPVMWMPRDNAYRRDFVHFTENFRTQDVILVSWEGCTVDDERLDVFSAALAREDDGHASRNPDAFFERVVSGRSSLKVLRTPPLRLTRRAAVARLRGSLIGPEGTTCAMIVLTRNGAVRRREAIAQIRQVLRSDLELADDRYHVGGTPVIGLEIDRQSVHSLEVLSIPSSVVIILLCFLFLRSWRLSLLILVIGFFGERMALACVHFGGGEMNAVLVIMSPLVFVLAVSTGIHLCNYYRDELRSYDASDSARRMLSVGWRPCMLSAATTAVGLLSLLVSEITAVRQFAIISAACVLVTTALMLVALPGFLDRWPVYANRDPSPKETRGDRWLTALSAWVNRRKTWIVVSGLSLMVVAGYGLHRMRTRVAVFGLLTSESATARDHDWLEAHVAPLIPVETIVRFDAGSPRNLIDRLRIVRDVQAAAAKLPPARGTTSALTFLPPFSTGSGLRATARRSLLQKRFGRYRDRLAEMGYLSETPTEQAWRVTTRVPAREQLDYSSYLTTLKERARAAVARRCGEATDVRIDVTGVMPIISGAQEMLLQDLVGSFFTALIVIGLVIVVGLRSVRLGLVAMIPNVFPLIVLFGVMAWMGQPLDIGAMMTASVALGIAVDDTVHFVLYCQRQTAAGSSPSAAVSSAIRHCGKAIGQTTLVCGLGLLVFAVSGFEPTRRFAWMMFSLLSAALVADLVLLPALLAGPFKGVLRKR